MSNESHDSVCAHCDGTGQEPFETSAYPPEPCSACGPRPYHESHDDDAEEVRTRYDAGVLAGTIGLATLIGIVMAGTVIVWAAMVSCQGAMRP